jgi:hypothetical protein
VTSEGIGRRSLAPFGDGIRLPLARQREFRGRRQKRAPAEVAAFLAMVNKSLIPHRDEAFDAAAVAPRLHRTGVFRRRWRDFWRNVKTVDAI